MGVLRSLRTRLGEAVDRIDRRIDRPAKDRGTYTQGSEQMVDSATAREIGRATSNKRSGFGRGL